MGDTMAAPPSPTLLSGATARNCCVATDGKHLGNHCVSEKVAEHVSCVPPPLAVAETAPAEALEVPADWTLNERQLCEVELLLSGALAPLQGFMDYPDYKRVCTEMRLVNGEVFPLPIVLAIKRSACSVSTAWLKSRTDFKQAEPASKGKTMKLRNHVGVVVAELTVSSVFPIDLAWEQQHVLGTTEEAHPYVAYQNVHYAGCVYVGGLLSPRAPVEYFDFREFRLSPAETRQQLAANGWKVVVGFQTRNPMHRSHFELTLQALQQVAKETQQQPHLLLTPAVGPTQPGDVPYHLRVRCYKKLLPYYPEKVLMTLIPLPMRMAGPRECLWHALIRKNYGCTHFIVGRDHAGPSACKANGEKFYAPYAAHDLLAKFAGDLGITPVFGHEMVYLGRERGYQSIAKLAKEEVQQALSISGTEFRRRLERNEEIPEWFSFPVVVEELRKHYKSNHQRGVCIYFTGIPCSGKSTLAQALEAALNECGDETRRITLLDADIVRQHLSKGLGFSREDRSTNVRRIGYVASEVAKHGGICLVANIAPYAVDREFNRNLIACTGGQYVEIYVNTPLSVCEQRDVKELYRKARQGIIKQFTGISDPYEPPEKAEIVIDSSSHLREKIDIILDYLRDRDIIKKKPSSEQSKER